MAPCPGMMSHFPSFKQKLGCRLTETLTGQLFHTQVPRVASALCLSTPGIDQTLRKFIACLKLARVGLITKIPNKPENGIRKRQNIGTRV